MALALLLKYGMSLYAPVLTKISGAKTMEDVETALLDKVWQQLQPNLSAAGFETWPEDLYYIAYKEEQKLEAYGLLHGEWKLIKAYPFTAMSGKIGPKLKEGDRQIPEGLYKIEYFNPNSSYYLSMKIDYPSAFDQRVAKVDGRTDIGSDIFIHGKAVSIGCLAVGDAAIEELFMLSSRLEAKTHQVLIVPWDFRVKPEFPIIDELPWVEELYEKLRKELMSVKALHEG